MDWLATQYEICEGIAAELDKSSEFEEFVVAARQEEGKLWKVFVDLTQYTKSGLDETLEGAAAWWAGPPKGGADVLSVNPETEQINLRFATCPPPEPWGRIKIYPPRFLEALLACWKADVAEKDARGITSHPKKLSRLLDGYSVCAFPQEEIISRLYRLSEKLRVLSVETNTRIPYTSVFFKLECGYWNADAEARLRAGMPSRDRWSDDYDDDGVPLLEPPFPDQGSEAFKESENWPKPAPKPRRRG